MLQACVGVILTTVYGFTSVTSYHPLACTWTPMDLGRFDISKGPSNRGGLDLGLFEESNRPSNEVEFSSKSPIHRLKPLIFAHSLRSVEGISLVQTQYWCPRDVGR